PGLAAGGDGALGVAYAVCVVASSVSFPHFAADVARAAPPPSAGRSSAGDPAAPPAIPREPPATPAEGCRPAPAPPAARPGRAAPRRLGPAATAWPTANLQPRDEPAAACGFAT